MIKNYGSSDLDLRVLTESGFWDRQRLLLSAGTRRFKMYSDQIGLHALNRAQNDIRPPKTRNSSVWAALLLRINHLIARQEKLAPAASRNLHVGGGGSCDSDCFQQVVQSWWRGGIERPHELILGFACFGFFPQCGASREDGQSRQRVKQGSLQFCVMGHWALLTGLWCLASLAWTDIQTH